MPALSQSIGHLMFRDGYEYFRFERDVFQVPQAAHMHTRGSLKGVRVGARFYCTFTAWLQSPLAQEAQ